MGVVATPFGIETQMGVVVDPDQLGAAKYAGKADEQQRTAAQARKTGWRSDA